MNLNGKKWKGRKRMIAIKEKNVITIEFEDHDTLESPMLYQYDKGQKIKFLDVPDGAEVQFSNWATEMTKNKIVVNGQVEIPDFFVQQGNEIVLYIQYIDSNSETTMKKLIIPVEPRTRPGEVVSTDDEPSFRQQIENIMEETKEIAKSVREDAENGKFNGSNYVLTEQDKEDIAKKIEGSGSVYITEI